MAEQQSPNGDGDQRRRVLFFETLRRVAEVTQASAEMVAHAMENAERVVDDILRDTGAIAKEANTLGISAMEGAREVRRAVISTPRVTRIVKEVMWVVATYRLHEKRHELFGTKPSQAATDRLHVENADRLYRLCVENRGALIKLGQLASARVDLLPKPYIDKLALLQDQVPPVATEDIKVRIEEELGRSVEKLFEWFDDEPTAAASLGQVHRARLHSGEEVVVKVQIPGIEALVESDLAAFRIIAHALKEVIPKIDLVTVSDELSRSVMEELSYEAEADSAEAFRQHFAEDTLTVAPAMFRELSSNKVLTLEWLDGKRLLPFLDNCENLGEDGEDDRDRIFELMIKGYCAQVLEHGLFHSDPHPGNFLVMEGPRLAWLDYGSVMRFTPEVRRSYAELAGTIVTNDAGKMAELFEQLGFRTRSAETDGLRQLATVFLAAFRDDLAGDLSDLDPTDQMEKALSFVRENPVVQIPHSFVLLGRVFATVAGYVLRYKPKLSLYQLILPYLAKAVTP